METLILPELFTSALNSTLGISFIPGTFEDLNGLWESLTSNTSSSSEITPNMPGDEVTAISKNLDFTEFPLFPALGSNPFSGSEDSLTDILGKSSELVSPGASEWASIETIDELLEKAEAIAVDNLTSFQESNDYLEDLKIAFGEDVDLVSATSFISNLISGEVEIAIETIIDNPVLTTGAFSPETNSIYFSEDFLSQHLKNPETVSKILLEEWGHYLDSAINIEDSSGDEGEIFANLVKGFSFDITDLKSEDDTTVLTIGDNSLAVELAFETINLTPSWIAYQHVSGVVIGFKRDATVSALTDIWFNGSLYENIQSPINLNLDGQFSIITRVSNTQTEIKPDGTIGFRPGFIRPRLTVNAPRWIRVL
jgi:hypothetical protein